MGGGSFESGVLNSARMGKTVLIVDDDREFVANLAGALQRGGFAVLAAGDGTEALHRLDRDHESIDAVIVDLNLPGVNGFEVIGALTRRKNLIGIMATTGVYGDTFLEVAKYLGANIAVRKPPAGSDLSAWVAVLKSVLKAEGDMGAASSNLE